MAGYATNEAVSTGAPKVALITGEFVTPLFSGVVVYSRPSTPEQPKDQNSRKILLG
jgi:hypothetical protein